MCYTHSLGNNLTREGSTFVQIRIPELNHGLGLEPPQANKQREDDTALEPVTSSLLSGPKHVLCNDPAVRIGKIFRLELAGNHLFDLVLQPQCNLGDLLGRMWWGDFVGPESREHC